MTDNTRKRKVVSTLDTPNLTYKKKDGNTTRQIDFAIQELYRGHEVLVQDHHRNGKVRNINLHLYNQILDRIHTHDDNIIKNLKTDNHKLSIYIDYEYNTGE